MLPSGTEGGKEFSRIVDLLLFHEAKRKGRKITIFNDAAGDYHGLDSFEGDKFRIEGTVGYQYKFYPSPLSSKHRDAIEKSLIKAMEAQEEIGLTKWILVTPQDLIESAVRKDGGDVTWFESLRNELQLKFEIEHLGHTKLKSLFLDTPSICLYYYPELVPDGKTRRRTIWDTRVTYNENLNAVYHKIEFVGMPVYKDEETRGVPLEHIYIPLTAVPNSADENDNSIGRINPLSFLSRGSKSVVLGDPGSGKSTLLRFLALSTYSEQIQERYNAEPDNRLPVIVTLRRYADELKERKNLSLIDYILESIQGDYSLKSADLDFFEYYLESGQAILLFDGLDELPNSQFKKTIRDRIRTLNITYPGNTNIVTSRIVGYSNPFRFDEKEFTHYRLTRLQLPEMEQFVKDWYTVRIESKKDREANVNDLIRVLRNEDHIAIRELAENPLLLTIVALVHKIDAVLPDERVVLYKKCTETLLNTWHTWKYKDNETKNKGKIERHNLQRMEAIAHWIHCQSKGIKAGQRSTVKHEDLLNFLTSHIVKSEKNLDPDNDPEDLAEEFLEFVKKRAGLLIEIGDNQYSFVHLTFQEYLTASYIITDTERHGTEGIWNVIKDHCNDAKWHEVIRLLVASLRSEASQEFIVEKVLSLKSNREENISLLLGGLLIDGIESATLHKQEIFEQLLISANSMDDVEQLNHLFSMLRLYLKKDEQNGNLLNLAFRSIWAECDLNKKLSLVLISFSLNCPRNELIELTGAFLTEENRHSSLIKLFLMDERINLESFKFFEENMDLFWAIQNCLLLSSSYTNFAAVLTKSVTFLLDFKVYSKRVFEEEMIALSSSSIGPFVDLNLNSLLIFSDEMSHLDLQKVLVLRFQNKFLI